VTSKLLEHAARRRKVKLHRSADRRTITDTSDKPIHFTVGGRLVHHRTHRCAAFCNAVAALAGIGPVEAR
jgi:hypothetical protein